MNSDHTLIESIRLKMAADSVLSRTLEDSAEVITLPFQKSKEIRFVCITVVIKSEQVSRSAVMNVIDHIIQCPNQMTLYPNLWGLEILACGVCDNLPQRLIRVMIPSTILNDFDSSQISNCNQNFAERAAGWIWYSDGKKMN